MTGGTRVNLDLLNKAKVAQWKVGQTLLLSGKLLTGQDAAHKRLTDLLAAGDPLPVDLHSRAIYLESRLTRSAKYLKIKQKMPT